MLLPSGPTHQNGLFSHCDQDVADAVEVVRRDGEILDARLGHGRDRAPGVAGHVADHGRVDRHARALAELRGVAEQPQQFLRPAEPGEFVQVHAVERDLAALDGVEELRALLSAASRCRNRSAAQSTSTFQTNRAPSG